MLTRIGSVLHPHGVGFEDSRTLPDDGQPDSNARFVEWAVRLARSLGREPLSPGEARPLLGLS